MGSMGFIKATPVVRILLIANISFFLIQMFCDSFLGTHLLDLFALVPYHFVHQHWLWQIVTYLFVHGDLFHILFNMLILWMIGSELEGQWGKHFFTRFYFICGISGGLFYLAAQFLLGSSQSLVPMGGSSGAIYGLLVAYGILFSERVMLFMMVFPMKAKHFVMILAAVEFVSTVFYSSARVANAAHLGGMVVGFGYLFLRAYLKIRARQAELGIKRKVRGKHLKLVVNNDFLKTFEDDESDNDDSKPTFH